MKKTIKIISIILAVLLSLAAITAPVGIVLGISFAAPSQYSNTFYGALDLKYDRLTSIKGSKTVVVGGSSVAFGLDSALLEKYLGMPVVNFGLYADLGTRLMLDLSRDHINSGDIVILAPELDPQTLSMYFDWGNTLKACDDNMSMLGELDRSIDEWLFSVEGFWELASNKLAYSIDGTTPDPKDVYSANNFNEYGDIDKSKYPRENNVMKSYRLFGENYLVDLDASIVENEFLEYINEYIRECRQKGAYVYFSWCPVNSLALVDDSVEKRLAFEEFFRENLECDVISSIDDYIMHPKAFYDTNFHLNDTGVTIRTLRLLNDIVQKVNPDISIEESEPTELPDYKYTSLYEGPDDPNAVYFTYETDEITGSYKIIGLSELGKVQKTLTVPLGYREEGEEKAYKVTSVSTDIFAGSACERLIITADTNIGSITGYFQGSHSLMRIDIYMPDPNEITPPGSFDNVVGSGFKIHAPRGSGYRNQYNWQDFDYIIEEDL